MNVKSFLIYFRIFLFIFTVIAARKALADSVECENDQSLVDKNKACNMLQTTAINSDEVTIFSPKDATVRILNLSDNKKILFLPIRVDKNFPNLTSIDAHGCSLTTISKYPFYNLRSLKQLNLNQNQIEKISFNSFNDLHSLEVLILGMADHSFNHFMFVSFAFST